MRNICVPTSTLALAALVIAMLACRIGQTEERVTLFDQYYIIEPLTLVDSLKANNTNAFSPISKEPELLPVEQQVPVNWLQGDYFFIADTLYEKVLGKTLQDWQLSSMDFDLGCSKIGNGFQNGRFTFFRVVQDKEQKSRFVRPIDIDPRRNFVHTTEWKYYPSLINLETIDLSRLKINAENALQIAESNGGKEKRQLIEDACEISLGLYPNSSNYKGWVVTYTRKDDGASLFRIQIDPYTGEIIN